MLPKESAGGIIVNAEGKIVLVEQNADSWSFPKGGIEAGESPLDAAKREIKEETGISELTFLADLGSYERYSIGRDGIGEQVDIGLRKRTFFLFKTSQTRLTPQDGEVTKVQFCDIDEAIALLTHPKDREFLQKVRSKVEEVR